MCPAVLSSWRLARYLYKRVVPQSVARHLSTCHCRLEFVRCMLELSKFAPHHTDTMLLVFVTLDGLGHSVQHAAHGSNIARPFVHISGSRASTFLVFGKWLVLTYAQYIVAVHGSYIFVLNLRFMSAGGCMDRL